MYDSSLGDPVWLMECKNPRSNFFFLAFCRTLLSSQLLFGACSADCFWGHACSADVAASGRVILLIIVNRLKIPQGLSTLFHQ